MKSPVLLFLLIVLMAAPCLAQTKADLEKQLSSIRAEMDHVKKELNENGKNKKENLRQLQLIQKKLSLRQEQINTINQQIYLIQGDIVKSSKDVNKLKGELDTLKLQYEKSMVYAYKNRSNYNLINFIFSSASFNDAVQRMFYLRSYRNYREKQAENIIMTQHALAKKMGVLNGSKQAKSIALKEENDQRAVLKEEETEKNAMVAGLKLREKELAAELAAKRKQDQKLNMAITAMIRRVREKKIKDDELVVLKKNTKGTVKLPLKTQPSPFKKETPSRRPTLPPIDVDLSEKSLSETFLVNKGRLPWPVAPGRIKMGFGRQRMPGSPNEIENPGITIETAVNQPVKAIFDGEVTAVIPVGNTQAVMIQHGRFFSAYSNLSSVSVTKGTMVKTGQLLGHAQENRDGEGEIELVITEEYTNLNPERWIKPQ